MVLRASGPFRSHARRTRPPRHHLGRDGRPGRPARHRPDGAECDAGGGQRPFLGPRASRPPGGTPAVPGTRTSALPPCRTAARVLPSSIGTNASRCRGASAPSARSTRRSGRPRADGGRIGYNNIICTVSGCWGRILWKRTNFGIPNEINAVRFPWPPSSWERGRLARSALPCSSFVAARAGGTPALPGGTPRGTPDTAPTLPQQQA
jgi:hypothetical protein